MTPPTPARRAALRVLLDVAQGGQGLSERLAAEDCDSLPPRERGFLHELALGTVRHRGYLDHALRPLLDRPLSRVDPAVLWILRLGAHQVLHLRVPDRAAVSATVDLAREQAPRAGGFVNAVLRGLVRQGAPAVADPAKDPLGWMTTEGSLPEWLAKRWLDRLGATTAVARARAALLPAPATLRLNPRIADARERCLDAGIELRPLTLEGALRATGGRLAPLAQQGVLYVQDEGSQIVARLAAGPGLTLDACAAPGGKATLIADLSPGDVRVVAAEASPRRARTLATLVTRWGAPSVTVAVADARHPPFSASGFDTVLLDAPCTGLGTLSRHPDIRWRARGEDVARHSARQAEMLAAVASRLRPGGRLVYAVCSLEEEETVGVVRPFLEAHAEFAKGALPAWAAPFADDAGYLRTRPESFQGDGFFAALLEKAPRGM